MSVPGVTTYRHRKTGEWYVLDRHTKTELIFEPLDPEGKPLKCRSIHAALDLFEIVWRDDLLRKRKPWGNFN